jgi:drug/metabolite transporter (DMT)-like permease
MINKNIKAYIMLTLCSLFWSGNFIVGKFATLYEAPPLTLNFFRWLIVWIILIPFTLKDIIKNFKIIKNNFYSIFFMSITSISVFNSVVYYSLNFTQVLNGALMISTIPVLIIFISFIFRTEKINFNQILGVIFSITGVIIIITRLDFFRLINLDLNKGDLWLLIAMLSWAIYSTMLRTYKIPLKALTFISIIVSIGLIFLLPQFLFEYKNYQIIQFNFPVILITSYVVLFAGLGAYIFWNKGVSIVGPNKAGIFLHLMPVFSSFMAIFILNEKLMSFHIIGAVVIIVGIYLSSKKTLLK